MAKKEIMAIIKKPVVVSKTDAKPAAKPVVKAAVKSVAKAIEVSNPKDPRLKKYQDSLYVRTTSDQNFSPGSKTTPLTKKEQNEWKDKKTGLVPNVVEIFPGMKKKGEGYFGHFKKPTQPIVYKKPTAKVENKVAKVDTIQTKPRVKKAGERIVADNRSGNGYPNVDNVYINNKLDSIQNQAGERLKYGTKFTKEWQYKNTGKKK